MAIFNDLAVELQEAIWELVLPAARGVHWIEIEGTPHDPEFIRDSIRLIEWHKFDYMPETERDVIKARKRNPGFRKRAETKEEVSGPFFRYLYTTVPSVFGRSGSADPTYNIEYSEGQKRDLVDEIAYTRRCRQLSTYHQIATLLSTCRLSRYIAKKYIWDNRECSWPIHRSMGSLYRPRPMEVWATQYNGDKFPPASRSRQALRPRMHTLDLIVFRLHDSQGRATPLLRQAAWQYYIESYRHGTTFGCFNRVGIEWHPSWGTGVGRTKVCSQNVQAIIRAMRMPYKKFLRPYWIKDGVWRPEWKGDYPTAKELQHKHITPYWLVDGVPRLNWKRDYPTVVGHVFARRMADEKERVLESLHKHWGLSDEDLTAMVTDQHLNQEFEANGRRYYIVFVVFDSFEEEERDQLEKAGLGYCEPFPGSASMWPDAIREPAQLAYDANYDHSNNLGTASYTSYILSWEPIY
ncbi:hypothetical protein BU24DRAFT_425651 [Aaosphaeria arxii CBS 175.79]|uniref:Uncharacterized protein n=1 Tax=Aaosphaeria arxii CBS 175.79 TaxID=1450172 RepID=A0A6A5XEZ6_9PLEO|nr:uncharacterized protein BU24DRAFT_425651 [Aaosphaeria arxii CBS 175.79]KAF2011815.1 hypothetical protein BU24DRAFT_425651 [Aaosphaeria arxii CBS 175.79]